MGMKTRFSRKLIKNASSDTFDELCRRAQVQNNIDLKLERRFTNLPSLTALLDEVGMPLYEPTMFLAEHSITSRSMTGATTATYAESLICWFQFLASRGTSINDVTEETFGLFRAEIANGKQKNSMLRYSSNTANLRVVTVAAFHEWAQRTKVLKTPLGTYLTEQGTGSRDRKTFLRVVRRNPRALSSEEIASIFSFAKEPYRLMFQWALVTGARRFEICALEKDQLPSLDEISYSTGLITIRISRKGGRDLDLIVPTTLIEKTLWYCFTDRPNLPGPQRSSLFLNSRNKSIRPAALTAEFRRCADLAKSTATLHMLRHTYATRVLDFLNKCEHAQQNNNPLKTLQVLMGHTRSETTQLYVHSLSTNSPAVHEALSFLYGMTL